jgi:hypothetical protein
MVHGVFNPQYQRYGKKILAGTDLKEKEYGKEQMACNTRKRRLHNSLSLTHTANRIYG